SNSLGSNSSYSVSPGSTTTYTVTGTSSGCSNTANVTVSVTALPNVTASATISPICAGSSSTISASGASTYNWSNSLGTNSSYSVSPSGTTTYTVTGTSSGCSNTANITVNVNPLPNVSASATYPTICSGENTDITASGASTYTWATLGSGTSHNVSPSSTTTYNVTGTDGNSCTNTASVTVTVGSAPAVVASAGDTTLCLGSTTTINATGAANYSWDQSLGAGSSHIISPTITTVYTVTGSTASGCTNTANVTVTVNPVPGDPTALATPSPICLGDSSLITASGGGTGLTYVVYSAPVGGTNLGNTGLTVYPATTTVYYVAAVNSYGCENTGGREPVTIIVNPLPTMPVVSASDTSICEGESVALLAGGSGTGVVYEVWTDTTGGSMIGYAPMMVSPTSDSVYYIQAVTASGCANPGGMVPFEIFVTPVLDAAMNAAGPFCIYDSVAILTAVNGGGAWSGTGITNTTLGYYDPSVAGIGTHNVTYTTTGVCSDTDTMQIVVTDVLDATINNSGPFCLSDPADTLTAANTGGIWAGTGITDTNNGVFDPSIAGVGTHEVVYTTGGSCSDTDTAYIVVQEQMDATIAASGPYCDNEAGVLLSAVDAGGTWSGNGILNIASGLFDPVTAGEGTHVIYYTIPGACGDIDSTVITVYEAPVLQISETDESCTGNGDGIIDIIVSGGTTPYSYLWNTGDNTPNLNNLTEGTYYLTVSDANSCVDVGMGILYDPNIECDGVIPHAVVPNAFSPNNDGENDVLFVRGEGIASLVFVVYDRWGEKVFETQDENIGWDGTFRGQKLDPGVFAYYLRVIFVDATEKIEKGDITLVR
ncbi:MAG: gliding motility-associated C-terminal domain-containing protein, partial [Bacteroidales bacterium]|nr:gliding motility-associated C-terminal domain-containing protein [Bacteroidales bacterium]